MGARAKKGCQRREAGDDERLLPRIPDAITLDLIAPKLSWGDCHRLSSVSRAWRHAIRSRQVHDARIRLQSTETLILLTYRPSKFSTASVVYSMRDSRCYELPPLPYRHGRMPPPFKTFQCVTLDGKVYVLGGQFMPPAPGEVPGNSGVYVLDLAAGGWQWKQCKSMIEPRAHFGCGVLDEKIFVVGGLSITSAVCGSEVYDPKEDTWSPIKAMRCLRFDHQVATMGTELVVYGGKIFEPTDSGWDMWIRALGVHPPSLRPYDYTDLTPEFKRRIVELCFRNVIPLICDTAEEANSLEVYHSIKDEWSVVEVPRGQEEVEVSSMAKKKLSFMAKGKYYVMNSKEILVHDDETNSWTHLHPNPILSSTRRLLDCELQMIFLRVAVAVDDKLLTIVEGVDAKFLRELKGMDKDGDSRNQACLLQGRGFGSDNEKIIWERTPFAITFEEKDIDFTTYSMHPVQV